MSGISISEFRTAMEVYQAERFPDCPGSRYRNVQVPCFKVKDTFFMHSGSYYIVQRGAKVHSDIMDKAMAELGEKHPGSSNFWWGEIHSVRGILTLASMLEDKYSKEKVDEMTAETFKRLLDYPKIKENFYFKYNGIFAELYKVLSEFDNMVNPYGNSKLELSDPKEYLDKINIDIATCDDKKGYCSLSLSKGSIVADMSNNKNGVSYHVSAALQEKRKNVTLYMGHYYVPENESESDDEVVYLDYNTSTDYKEHPEDIDLRISLKTGLAWRTYHEEEAHPATKEELDVMIKYLKTCINKINRRIVRYMVK